MDRRTFLKIAGMGSVAFAAGCKAHPERHLYTFVRAPEDMVTGESNQYATTCRECPAGCGVLAVNRENRAVKLEGNPLHPVNQGKLCARGQAALQGLYNPDRLRTPLVKTGSGGSASWKPVSHAEALGLLRRKLSEAAAKGPQRAAMLSEVAGDSFLSLGAELLGHFGSGPPLVFEPLAFESLKFAHVQVFGQPVLPSYRMERADVLIGFGADFLESWLSPIEYAGKFAAMHALHEGRKGLFLDVGPVRTLTSYSADRWMACQPGGEAVVLMGLIGRALEQGRGRGLAEPLLHGMRQAAAGFGPDTIARRAGLASENFEILCARMLAARRPLILGSAGAGGPAAPAVDLAAALLNVVLDPRLSLYDFDRRHRVEIAHPRSAVLDLLKRAAQGQVDVLLLNSVNPVYALPAACKAADCLARPDLFVAAFAHFMDESAAAADLIIPTQMPLEMWDLYEGGGPAVISTLQPVVGQLDPAVPHAGDVLLQVLPPDARPAGDYRGRLIRQAGARLNVTSELDWLRLIQVGGRFESLQAGTPPAVTAGGPTVDLLSRLTAPEAAAQSAPQEPVRLQVTASLRFYDGRGANRPWLPEMPDPVSQIAWQTVALVHPRLMADKGWADGELVRLGTADGRIELPAVAHQGLDPGVATVAMGQGHTGYGRYAGGQGVDPVAMLPAAVDADSGGPVFSAVLSTFESLGRQVELARVSGSADPHGRKIALSVSLEQSREPVSTHPGLVMNDFPLTLPLPEGYDAHRDFYPAHAHEGYRWAMVVDLDRCTGCSACVAACYAENNIGVTGQRNIVKGREMNWIRIERYRDPNDPSNLVFLPMMCQHCDNAPCESVCPVYAPHHSKEGLNNQIYNRCIGTRFCAQNCPYKVRRFNWFDWQWPEPLNLQLNPDVTVRSKGVMEKCSFCIQRIKKAHDAAKNENRAIRDGEVVPACVQTCPTQAIRFGNLMDPASQVRALVGQPRAYQVMGYLNTKPAVIYLKKVIQPV